MRLNVIAFAAGILWLQCQPEVPAWAGTGLLFGAALLLAGWRRHPLLRLLALAGGLLVGIGYAGWRAEARLSDGLASAWEGRDIEVVGLVAELPQRFHQGSRFRFDIERVLTPDAAVPKKVMLSWYAGRRDDEDCVGRTVREGERWRLKVRLKRPHGNANPNGFDYEAWLLERGIRATGYVRSGEDAQRLAEMVWTPTTTIERLRGDVRASFERMLPENEHRYAGVLLALVIGDQRAIHGDLWNTFNRTGVTHLMSISGLHVTMIAALAAACLGFVWRRVPALAVRLPAQRAAIVAGVLAAAFYTLIAGFGIPAQRTLYMLLVAAVAMYTGRAVAPSRVLCLALALVLLVDPWAVMAAGFWLSFGAVGALLWIGTGRVGEGGGWWWRLRQWGAVQWAATLASVPVLLVVFQQFSLVSPLANAAAIPLVSFVITPLALLAALVPWWPLLTVAHAILELLMAFLDWCAAGPVWLAPSPPLWVAAVGAIGVAWMLLPRGIHGRWLGLVLLAPTLTWLPETPEPKTAWIDVLDVGQGLAVVVRTRNHVLLYDAGPMYSAESDAGQRIIVPYLRALGISRVDHLMVTHRDTDHSGGAASVRASVDVAGISSSVNGYAGERCLAGQRWLWDGVAFEVLHPGPRQYAESGKSNHLSCVLRIEAGGRRMLLTSDIEAADEAALLAAGPEALRADLMLAPHHGSRTSSTPAFLDAIGASVVVVPVGYRNRFGHPKEEVVQRYLTRGARVWRTDRDGALLIRLAEAKTELLPWRAEHKRYWHDR